MNGVLEAALQLQSFFLARQWRFCFIGGLAVQKWSEPRVTEDADVTLFTGFGGEDAGLRDSQHVDGDCVSGDGEAGHR
jgi:hypothetical protein